MIKIGHYADIQVKVRDNSLYKLSYEANLMDIAQQIKSNELDVVVIAGDLWEFYDVNDIERLVIYNHIADLLNIESLKEVVIMLGNHDLPSEKKVKEITRTNNPLDTLYKFISEISPKLLDKLTYLKKQEITCSKAYKNLNWIPFSLEDGKSNGDVIRKFIEDNPLDPEKKYITIYHDILDEYVEESGLPISESTRKRLANMSMFPTNEIIAGDIHELWTTTTEEGKKFFYPGSTQQRNFGEGSYAKIRDKVKFEDAAEKFMLVHEYSDNLEYITTKHVTLCNFIKHITIDIMSTVRHDNIFENITQVLNDFSYGVYQTFIKVKASNIYLDDEIKIMEVIKSHSLKLEGMTEVLPISYEKIVTNKINETNKVIEVLKVLDETTDKTEQEKESLSIINLDNIENLTTEVITDNFENVLLTEDKLVKIFEALIEVEQKEIIKLLPSDVTFEAIKLSLTNLFTSEIGKALNASQNYKVTLVDIGTNNFMPLGPNTIHLHIPGLTRIEGPNGTGKTTLYTLIYWTIKGKAFEYLKDNQAVKNNLHIFNDEQPTLDTVKSVFNILVNDVPVKIKRYAVRKWKAKATEEDKTSIDWKDYISGVTTDVEVSYENDGILEVFTGIEAQEKINLWFGNTIDNILFLNQFKINQLLNKSSDDLQNLTLDYIGIDYIKKLINSLPVIKESMGVVRPKRTKAAIKFELDETNKKLVNIDNLDSLIEDNENLKNKLFDLNETVECKTNELVSFGNIPESLNTVNIEIKHVQNLIDTFERTEIKDVPELTLIKPEQIDLSNYDSEKESLTAQENELKTIIFNAISLIDDNSIICKRIINDKLVALNNLRNNVIETHQTNIETLISDTEVVINDLKVNIWDSINSNLVSELNNNNTKLNQISFNVKKLQDDNVNIIKQLESTICSECGKPLSDNTEEHKVYINEKNSLLESNKIKIEKLSNLSITVESIINEYNLFINMFNSLLSTPNETKLDVISERINTLEHINSTMLTDILNNIKEYVNKSIDLPIIKNKLQNLLINKITDNEDDNNKLNTISRNEELLNDLSKSIQSGELSNIDNNLGSKILNSDNVWDNLMIAYKTKTEKKLELSDVTIKLQKLTDEYISESKSYESKRLKYDAELSEHYKLVDEIQKFNQTVNEHNNKLFEHKTKLDLLLTNKIELTNDLPGYELVQNSLEITKNNIQDVRKSIDINNETIKSIELNKINIEKDIERITNEYQEYIDYEKAKAEYAIYDMLISKKFKLSVFAYYRQFLNVTFNILLQNMNFKLNWHEDGNLYYVKYENGKRFTRPVQLVSGMETCFLGLSLTYAIHTLNIKNNISHLFIDEISGQLNSGKELVNKDNVINYQEQLLDLLSKFENKSIFIIDHVIKDMYQTVTYNVTRKDNKSFYEEI